MISPIFAARALPPGEQSPISASPAHTAAAYPEQPAYPHPPQLAPGIIASILISFSSFSTASFLSAIARPKPSKRPRIEITKIAAMIPIFPSLY